MKARMLYPPGKTRLKTIENEYFRTGNILIIDCKARKSLMVDRGVGRHGGAARA
jgi:hypothetical protein